MKTNTPSKPSVLHERIAKLETELAELRPLLSRYVSEPTFNQKLKAEAVEALERWRVKDPAQK